LAIDLRHREESHPGNFAIYWVIATAFAREGRLNEAYDALTTALDIQIATLSPEHPDIAMTYTEIGKILESLDDFSQALFYYERAMDILRQHESPTDPDIAQTQQHINRLYKKLDRYHASQST
jgi:tetratricopeptide (TPR) repeat protein